MTGQNILIAVPDAELGSHLQQEVLLQAGYQASFVLEGGQLADLIHSTAPDAVLITSRLADVDGLSLAAVLAEAYPTLPLILLALNPSRAEYLKAFRAGFWECLPATALPNELDKSIQACLARRDRLQDWLHREVEKNFSSLQVRLEVMHQAVRKVTSLLDLDEVLTAVVDAAVELTAAEKGSLLLLDEKSGELYMRASRNFQEDFVRRFRLRVDDSLAGQVVRTGQVMTIEAQTPQKIKTSYLVHTLIYVPLQVRSKIIGVLGVDNRQGGDLFHEQHRSLLTTLADYAAIAIQNAQAYNDVESEHARLHSILTQVEDGVLVVGLDNRLLIANTSACKMFHLETPIEGKIASDVIDHPDLLDIFAAPPGHPTRIEIRLKDGRIFIAQTTPIPQLGIVITMQDITRLKELDRIKSEFVSTVSHDLRSPLTAILGYVELINRVGPVNEQQHEFIRRVQVSVQNITALITDLLDLGRIEAGFDVRNEVLSLSLIIQAAIELHVAQIRAKGQELAIDVPDNLPQVLGNPIRLRQVVANLIGNAHKYTPKGGSIAVRASVEDGQIIFQIIDNGLGIPSSDQPYVFDKFYRASNVNYGIPGTGLGLAIVKSIVEAHSGRIWVESILGKGSIFTVVLPIYNTESSHLALNHGNSH